MKCEEMYGAKCIYVKVSKTVGRLFTENKMCFILIIEKKFNLKKIKLKTVERKLYNINFSQQLENT